MRAVEFRGDRDDLERFARSVLKRAVTIDAPSPFEHRMRWDAEGTGGFGTTLDLRSGIKLAGAKLRWDRPWAFRFSDAATPLKLMVCRGLGPRMTLPDGTSHVLEGGALHVRRASRPVSTTCEFVQGGAEFEQVALEIEPQRLRELLGAPRLPEALEQLLSGSAVQELHRQPLTPALSRLLDEILYAGGRGASRQLLLEAKGLELLAVLIDELTLASEAASPLSARDVERLERARRLLRERMDAPPGVPELARAVGLNEFKLKAGFRSHFGTSVYGCLRVERMEHARRLLVQRHLSVAEVAALVGFANPSKFAQAFRRHFGFPPSGLR